MLTICGKIINIFTQPRGEKDGKENGGQSKIQIIGDIDLPDGDKKVEMFNLTAHDITLFQALVGKQVNIPVGVFNAGKSIMFYIPKGAKPREVTA